MQILAGFEERILFCQYILTFHVLRLKKGHPLEDYGIVQLRMEFEKLTGESVKDILTVAGVEENIASVRQLLHFTIIQANIVGMPVGQTLNQTDSFDSQPKTTGIVCLFDQF